VLEVLYHRAKFGGTRISPAAIAAKNVEFFTGSIARSATRRYLIYSEADFAFFALSRCTDGEEIWHGGGDGPLRAKFHPIGATVRV